MSIKKKKGEVDILALNEIQFCCRVLVKNPHSLWECYLRFFYNLLRYTMKGHFNIKRWNKIVFIAPSDNNRKSLVPVMKNLPAEDTTLMEKWEEHLSFARIYWYSLFYQLQFIQTYWNLPKRDKPLVRMFWYDFMTAYGTYKVLEQTLLKNKHIEVLVFANDHIMPIRCLLQLADKYQIKTLYTQHASVTEEFPSLSFTYSFLDGIESYTKYRIRGNIKGDVILSGCPRFDLLCTVVKKETEMVGIALNELDDIEMVRELCHFLSENLQIKIAVRPHPALERLTIVWEEFEKEGYGISYPSKETSFEFVSRIKLLIANESGIHLDSVLMKTPSLLYNFSKNQVLDWYSYVKNGLIPYVATKEELLAFIKWGVEVNTTKAKEYNAAFSTPYEGKVSILIADFLKAFCKNEEVYFLQNIFKMNDEGVYEYK